ncbi:hypothetical protein ABD91_26050 [Lysinibacillus sphaericus]|uniref:hypothetical protein n=1 Tax=Lysinibacillus sphaericus TaxID=1421 RepID=UPI0018CF939F|nr:hypothetical protein [Lysinibacillus sphaericus]MBG9694196.1 hypothetical protein [Lysinibacillus sphaericus]
MTIISMVLIFTYLLSGIITWLGFFRLSASAVNPVSRTFGIILLLLGATVRFITLLLAWFNGLPLYMACIAQFIPIVFFFLFFLLYEKINAIRKK